MTNEAKLGKLNLTITRCKKCPRLVKFREAIGKNPPLRYRGERYWARPLPGFGDPKAQIYIIGLAPAANGGNRTGRIFTGDRSGDWLYGTLYAAGLANQETSISKDDGLQVFNIYVGAAVRCAPPDNKPTIQEFENCRPYLAREFDLLPQIKAIVVLGSLAYNATKKILRSHGLPKDFRFPPFGHGKKVALPDGKTIICSYHPSQQNTFTKKLTREMFRKIFEDAKNIVREDTP